MTQAAPLPCLVVECRQQHARNNEPNSPAQRIRVFTFCPIVLSRGGRSGCAGRRVKLVVVCHCGATHEAVGEFSCGAGELRSCADDSLIGDVLNSDAKPNRDDRPKLTTVDDASSQDGVQEPDTSAWGKKLEMEPLELGSEPAISLADSNSDATTISGSEASPANSYFNFGVHGLGVSMTSESLRNVLQEEPGQGTVSRKDTAMPLVVDSHSDEDSGQNAEPASERPQDGQNAEPASEQPQDAALPPEPEEAKQEEEDDDDDLSSGSVKPAQQLLYHHDPCQQRGVSVSEQTIELETGQQVDADSTAVEAQQTGSNQVKQSESEPAGAGGAPQSDDAAEAEAAVKAVEERAKREYSSLELADSNSDKMTEDGSPERDRMKDFGEGGGEFDSSQNSATGRSNCRARQLHQPAVAVVYQQYPFNEIYSVNYQIVESPVQQQQKAEDTSRAKGATLKNHTSMPSQPHESEKYLEVTTPTTAATILTDGAGSQEDSHGPKETDLKQFINQTGPSAADPEEAALCDSSTVTSSTAESVMVRIGSYDSLTSAQSRIFHAAAADQKKQQLHSGPKNESQHQPAAEMPPGQCQCVNPVPVQSVLVLLQQSVAALSAASASAAAAAASVTTACLTQNALTTSCQPQVQLCSKAQRIGAKSNCATSASRRCQKSKKRQQQQQQQQQQSNFANCNSSGRHRGHHRIRCSINRVLNWDCSGGTGRAGGSARREAAVHHLLQPTESLPSICSDVDSAPPHRDCRS
ncbi:hypothetical protein BOX15_Mlig028675g1 [Macrostomum lignano]|uniref:Uncharacterized protein n=1 Tax=Macrostomum lignano TaxID=282301 RepID=A0A267GTZ6_9PLAT|nr:hypothetical protein BOX15_Mlig028675g1 [Macrostomum lignano]